MPWSYTAVIALGTTATLLLLEFATGLARGRKVYALRDTLANVSAYLLYLVIAAVYGYLAYLIMTYAQLTYNLFFARALGVAYWPCLILAEDFCFYCFHRSSHKFGLLWASHVTHHSSDRFNLSTGLRQTWVPFVALPFWLPLALIGFDPVHILMIQSASLFYQFLMHTQVIDLPRAWGLLFNTPSHHRVHHGRNPQYIDRNFGGLLIVWDRLFGTFTAEAAPVHFGVEPAPARSDVLFIQFAGFADWLQSLIGRTKPMAKEDGYATQKNSYALAVLLFLVCAAALIGAILNPRWFL